MLPGADWLVLACPLTERTRALIDAEALAPAAAACAPGERRARRGRRRSRRSIAALQRPALAGAYLDVFAHEPLPPDSPLWALPHVIATPHSAGFSDGNEARVLQMFLDNLRCWCEGAALRYVVG